MLVIFTNHQNLYTFSLQDLDQRNFQATQKSGTQKNRQMTEDNMQLYEESKHTTVTREF